MHLLIYVDQYFSTLNATLLVGKLIRHIPTNDIMKSHFHYIIITMGSFDSFIITTCSVRERIVADNTDAFWIN